MNINSIKTPIKENVRKYNTILEIDYYFNQKKFKKNRSFLKSGMICKIESFVYRSPLLFRLLQGVRKIRIKAKIEYKKPPNYS